MFHNLREKIREIKKLRHQNTDTVYTHGYFVIKNIFIAIVTIVAVFATVIGIFFSNEMAKSSLKILFNKKAELC